ncbi:MAG: iron-sulfur cluster loop [Bacteroidetes bacterium GWF2_35_48]|nr:MAG: iron-sulfur cluster loop [Bacteroidetes bacterium GWF2_35_48]
MEILISRLIEKGEELFNKPFVPIKFTKEPEVDEILNDIDNYPHQFLLACVMDRQIKAERAWKIPFVISKKINDFSFSGFLNLSEKDLLDLFQTNSLHRFNETMAICFYRAIQKINHEYKKNASLIWSGNQRSATIVRRFLQFDGVGVKIATMATNILAREFKVPMQDKICIDISPDVQVKRVFTRLGLISKNASNEELIYCARELNPSYPGVFDLSTWEIGRQWCRPVNPNCNECFLVKVCKKILD